MKFLNTSNPSCKSPLKKLLLYNLVDHSSSEVRHMFLQKHIAYNKQYMNEKQTRVTQLASTLQSGCHSFCKTITKQASIIKLTTSCYSNGSDSLPPRMDHSIVSARCCLHVSNLTHGSLGPCTSALPPKWHLH